MPNVVRWLIWFIGCCNTTGYQPTFKLFYTLFKLQKSTVAPLYELHFQGTAVGFNAWFERLVLMPNSLIGWHQEFIFILGGDVEYTPIFRTETIESFSVFKLGGDALAKVIDFCGGLGNQMIEIHLYPI